MSHNFQSTFQQGYSERPYGYMPHYPPRSYHRDPPSPKDMSQGSSSHSNESSRVKDDPDNARSFSPFGFGTQASGSGFHAPSGSQHMSTNASMFNPNHYQSQFTQEIQMQDIGLALDDPHSAMNSMMEHPSPGSSDGYLYDDESFLSSSSPPEPIRTDPLPPHDETEAYLRQNLSIFAPRPVDLTALPDEPFGNRQPKITDMIKLAIWGSPRKRLTLRQVYDAIESRYPSWKTAKDKPWQRSIRHNLSLKAIFVREERPVNHPGKGCYWVLDVRQGEGNKRDRKRKDQPSRSSGTSEDSDEDFERTSRGQSGPYGAPQQVFQPAASRQSLRMDQMPGPAGYYSPQTGSSLSQPPLDPKLPMYQGIYTGMPPIMGPNMRWSDPSAPPPHPAEMAYMQMHRGMPYPSYGLPLNVEQYPPMRRTGSAPLTVGPPYPGVQPFPTMPTRQIHSTQSLPPTRTRRPHSDISPEEDVEETSRGTRRLRSH